MSVRVKLANLILELERVFATQKLSLISKKEAVLCTASFLLIRELRLGV
jgi:hypothetical protein